MGNRNLVCQTLARLGFAAWFGIALSAAGVPADEPSAVVLSTGQPVADAQSNDGPIDFALATGEHLILARLNIRIGKADFIQAWDKFVDDRLQAIDADHDGVLSALELKAAAPLLGTARPNQNRREAVFNDGEENSSPSKVLMSDPSDAAVNRLPSPGITRAQLIALMRGGPGAPVRVVARLQTGAASRPLFVRLDRDHDGRLSHDECAQAFESLRPLDLAEIEVFTSNQLQPGSGMNGAGGNVGRTAVESPSRMFVKLLSSSFASSGSPARKLVEHFSPAGRNVPTTVNIPRSVTLYDETDWASLDGDGDGTLDLDELDHLARHPEPNLQLDVKDTAPVHLSITAPHLAMAAGRLDVSSGQHQLVAGQERFIVSVKPFLTGDAMINNQLQFMKSQFAALDADKNDYLDKDEIDRGGLTGILAHDANGDGKLYFDEIKAFLELEGAVAAHRMVIDLLDRGHGLFEAIDDNHDGRLSRRELRELVARAAEWDRDNDGQLTLDEVPHLYSLEVSQDRPLLPGVLGNFGGFVSSNQTVAARRDGPAWFVEMDRNGDGDLSRREFLGSLAQFRQLDADGDQLIGADEAAKATALIDPAGKDPAP